MPTSHSVIVIGAGISGLACAYALKKRGIDVLVLESNSFPGGMIRTTEENGYLFETGPQSFSTTPQLNELIEELGLTQDLLSAPSGAPRYIFVNGGLQPVPLSVGAFIHSSLLKWSTKLSLLREPLGKSLPPDNDESVADFIRRKFKPELLELLVGPFVSGIYAGDPEKISFRAAFPSFYEAEKAAGSVIRGMKAVAKKRTGPRVKPTLASFRRGNQTLIKALGENLGPSLQTGVRVEQIGKASNGRFMIAAAGNQFESSYLVLATPASIASSLLPDLAPGASEPLSQIEYAPVAVVSLAYRRDDVSHSLDGFGFLVPRSANLKILGTIWNSWLFPDRAPKHQVLLTSFLGGATDPDTASLSDSSLVELAHHELSPILGLGAQPVASRVTAHKSAIPQYNLGHSQRVAAIQSESSRIFGLRVTGNYLNGPAIGSCVEHAQSVADSIRIS